MLGRGRGAHLTGREQRSEKKLTRTALEAEEAEELSSGGESEVENGTADDGQAITDG